MNSTKIARWFIYGLLIVAAGAILWSVTTSAGNSQEISITELASQIRDGRVEELVVSEQNHQVTIRYKTEDTTSYAQISSISSLEEVLREHGINQEVYASTNTAIRYERTTEWGGVFNILITVLLAGLVLGAIFFFMRQSQGNSNQAMAFGKSRARLFNSDKPTVTFDDVAGANEAKQELT
ncbi:MAG: ATP-dependent metallopeptidase FtsH/Yme1/Tma family protein, partial [Anaerolineales bacterium]|nr:ATP-dependent metallopeptidase FtsH/Yme1/Tma family protein [Anaerolineales bacterium]